MVYKIGVLIFVFNLCSCQNKTDRNIYLLSNGTEKYWLLDEFTPKDGAARTEDKLVLKFGKGGHFKQYNKDQNHLYSGQYNSDVKQSDKWFFVNDSVINLNDYEYVVIQLNNENFKIRQIHSGRQFLYRSISKTEMNKFEVMN